jgi:hypothetical protein
MDLYCEEHGGEAGKFCKGLDGKELFSTLYGMYVVTLNELKVRVQAGQSGVPCPI